jgi:hypothetical protein
MDVDVSLWGMVNSPQHIQFFETIGLGGLSLGSDVAMELFFDGLKVITSPHHISNCSPFSTLAPTTHPPSYRLLHLIVFPPHRMWRTIRSWVST